MCVARGGLPELKDWSLAEFFLSVLKDVNPQLLLLNHVLATIMDSNSLEP